MTGKRMRERLIAAFVGLTIVVVSLYGVPRAYMLADLIQADEQRKIELSIDLVAVLLTDRSPDKPVTGEFLNSLLHEAERLEYTDADGRLIASAGTQLNGHPDDISLSRDVPGRGTVVMSRSGALVADRIADAVMPVVLLGLGLIVLSIGAGYVLACRLSRPFQKLAGIAEEMGQGNLTVAKPDYAMSDAQAIGAALYSSSTALKEILRREREFSANASHQLRTPITALRLELEDLALWPATAPEVSEQLTHSLGELGRLAGAVTELLDLARGHILGSAQEVDLARITSEASKRWERSAAAAGRAIVDQSPPSLPAVIPPGPVHQILDILIDNAIIHGAGDIVIKANDGSTHHSISVADHGQRPDGKGIFQRRTGQGAGPEQMGLALASELAAAIGGRLLLAASPLTSFTLILPSKPD
jgi:signal transduction histidine kinase